MPERPMTAVPVTDLARSYAFYVERLGFGRIAFDAAADLAQIDAGGYPILLAGPDAGDPRPHLDDVHQILSPGATLYGRADDADALRAHLAEQAVPFVFVERAWGDRLVQVEDPDGYTVEYWFPIERTPDEILALYRQGVEALQAALAGLDDADLDLSRAPGEWTIRQIVHHMTDSECTVLGGPKAALAEPGRTYQATSYSQETWAAALAYAERPIASSVALFAAIRAHMLDLMEHIPGAWERQTVDAAGRPSLPVGTVLGMLVSHGFEHVEQIWEIRRTHGV